MEQTDQAKKILRKESGNLDEIITSASQPMTKPFFSHIFAIEISWCNDNKKSLKKKSVQIIGTQWRQVVNSPRSYNTINHNSK